VEGKRVTLLLANPLAKANDPVSCSWGDGGSEGSGVQSSICI